MSGRNTQVSRIYTILNLLEGAPHGLTVGDLRLRIEDRDFKASKRTVYRDVEALEAAGFPLRRIEDESGDTDGARWVLERTARINGYLVLSPRELVGLYLAQQVLLPLEKTPFYADLKLLFGKIEDKLGAKSREHLTDVSKGFHFEPGPKWGLGVSSEVIDTVSASCAEAQAFTCEYASVNSDSKKLRKLGPHYLYFAKGSLYLVAEDMESKTVKTFSLARMTNAKMLDEVYEGVKTDPTEHFKDSFGIFRGENPVDVKISFQRETALYVKERSWHPSQQIVSKPDGVIEVKLHVALTPELQQWVLGFGSQARVLEPEALKDAVVGEAEKLVGLYNKRVKAA